MNLRSIKRAISYLDFNKLSLSKRSLIKFQLQNLTLYQLTILLDSEFVEVLAEPSDLKTVKAAAKCLNASVSGPPPATANN